jgi:predicted transcriptional regulator
MATETEMIMDKLNEIKSELDTIKKHMVDVDTVLTEDDVEALNEAEEDLEKGRTVKL